MIPATTPTGSGTTDYIPLWTSSTTLENSLLYQGTGYVKDLGIFELPSIGTASASKGYNSQPFYEFASAYNSSTKAAVVERFSWQVEPVGNNTASPSGTLNLLFASGTGAPAETGFSIGSNGSINNALILQGSVTDSNTGYTSANILGGYIGNSITNNATGATIAGGGVLIEGMDYPNTVSSDFGTVSGGYANTVSGLGSTVAGGAGNTASGALATVAGGTGNTAGGEDSTVTGGDSNTASGNYATVAGGDGNTARGTYSFVAGGQGNLTQGYSSFAAGINANAADNGSFVWCQQDNNECGSFGTNSFTVSVDGPIYFYDGTGGQGCHLSQSSASWSCSSDRNLKTNIVSIDSRSVLERVAQMPISQWSMKADTAGHKHIGPMAQDFYAAFGLGDTDKYIAQGDAQGVALASIQGLYQMVQQRDERIQRLEAQLQALEQRMARFESASEPARGQELPTQ